MGIGRHISTLKYQAYQHYLNHGTWSLIVSFAGFLIDKSFNLRGKLELNYNELRDRANNTVIVQNSESFTISYTGQFEDELPVRFSEVEGTIETPDWTVLELEDARVIGPTSIVGLPNLASNTKKTYNYFSPSSVGNSKRNLIVPSRFFIREVVLNNRNPEREIDSAFLFSSWRRTHFWHWFYEQLPKLRWYEQYCKLSGETPQLIIRSDLNPWQRTSLTLMGYGPEQCISLDEETLNVERLLVSFHPIGDGVYNTPPSNLQWVRDRIVSNVPKSERKFSERVYISRRDATNRHVRNEDEMTTMLETYGFESYELSKLSFEDQVRLFAGAEIIVGPHGAGLTNILYSENANVIELVTDATKATFFALANVLGHRYEFLKCDPIKDSGRIPNEDDIFVDVDELEDLLGDMLN